MELGIPFTRLWRSTDGNENKLWLFYYVTLNKTLLCCLIFNKAQSRESTSRPPTNRGHPLRDFLLYSKTSHDFLISPYVIIRNVYTTFLSSSDPDLNIFDRLHARLVVISLGMYVIFGGFLGNGQSSFQLTRKTALSRKCSSCLR